MELSGKLTVTELTSLIKANLEDNFSSLVVEGEVSNARPSSTGHLYFTLKDAGAMISGVMFKNKYRFLRFDLRDGMLVRVRGNLSVYPQRGAYQIICDEIEEAGAGDILALLERRKQAFAAEGLFDAGRKKPIPRLPQRVGVVSSPTGAAVQDILNILRRRAPGMDVLILPAPVQGAEAAPVIAARIEQANFWRLADVLIIGRGGGTLEDLLPFSEEVVVRAVAASEIPVISAVGHEIDWAISDFAADLRAPTPSAAAELVSENRGEILDRIRTVTDEFRGLILHRIERARLLMKPFKPEEMEFRIRSILQPQLVRFDDAKEALLDALSSKVDGLRHRIALAAATLDAASPLAILERGYSVVSNKTQGRLVRTYRDAGEGDELEIRPLEGLIFAKTEASRRSLQEVLQ